ncbi:hypothetical protein AX15_004116 [Amanita polypyramis BW_CC]|nr:hypothetical protein AX15_004116 [Amanita polypyramis BW_CC]
MAPVCFAYYCSGHGYGHATRVSAFASHLLKLSNAERPVTVYIVSSAPQHVFSQSIACGARYRHAEIDPVIVQPLAYRVDRGKSVQVLQAFLDKKDIILETERQWLYGIHADAVLSDAAFLGCQAAKLVGIPSILITNFTFDSVYSYLSTPLLDIQSPAEGELIPSIGIVGNPQDVPVPHSILQPLVEQIHFGYRCADILIRLPGHIPIPSFETFPTLPSSGWVDIGINRFFPDIVDHLLQPVETYSLHQPIPYPTHINSHCQAIPRSIIPAPLFVRPPSSPAVYSPKGRSQLLASIGVPESLRDSERTKILVVSFGGQIFRGPSRSGSRSRSRSTTPSEGERPPLKKADRFTPPYLDRITSNGSNHCTSGRWYAPDESKLSVSPELDKVNSRLVATPPHTWIPGAPPTVRVIQATPLLQTSPELSSLSLNTAIAPPASGPAVTIDSEVIVDEFEEEPRLLPDSSWIAVICGVSKEQWKRQLEEEELDLPDQFFVAPRDIYMPDLTAIGDVLLGKLGYGTVSECVDASTPFVYVSRPLFIEEHGLRLLLGREGVGMELPRGCYESGDWADAVEEAWRLGKDKKAKKRKEMLQGEPRGRQEEMQELAQEVLRWRVEI